MVKRNRDGNRIKKIEENNGGNTVEGKMAKL